MAFQTFTGRIDKVEVGVTVGENKDVTNVVLMNWERSHDIRPRLVANSKIPIDWQQPHSWVIGSLSLLSNDRVAFYETDVDDDTVGDQFALNPQGDSTIIDFFQVTYRDAQDAVHTTRFFGAIIVRPAKELLNYDDSVWIYHFLAFYAVDT